MSKAPLKHSVNSGTNPTDSGRSPLHCSIPFSPLKAAEAAQSCLICAPPRLLKKKTQNLHKWINDRVTQFHTLEPQTDVKGNILQSAP